MFTISPRAESRVCKIEFNCESNCARSCAFSASACAAACRAFSVSASAALCSVTAPAPSRPPCSAPPSAPSFSCSPPPPPSPLAPPGASPDFLSTPSLPVLRALQLLICLAPDRRRVLIRQRDARDSPRVAPLKQLQPRFAVDPKNRILNLRVRRRVNPASQQLISRIDILDLRQRVRRNHVLQHHHVPRLRHRKIRLRRHHHSNRRQAPDRLRMP